MTKYIKNLIFISLIIVAFIFCFWELGKSPLERWDEQTNANVVKELVERENLPSLYLENEPFFEKPPVWYYLTGIIIKYFGFNNFNLRLVSAISGFILFLAILFFARRYFGEKVAFGSGISFLTAGQLFITNPSNIFATHNIRSADLDILQILIIFLCIWLIFEYENLIENKAILSKKKHFLFIFGVSFLTAIAFLTKGLMAFLPLLIWFLWKIYKAKSLMKDYAIRFLSIFTLSLIFILPWYLYMFMNFGNEFLEVHFGYHNVARFTEPLEGHNKPWYFHLINTLNPTFFLFGFVFYIGIFWLIKKTKYNEFKYFFLILYSILILIIITLMQTKLSWYSLYLYPIGVIICGIVIEEFYLYLKQALKTFA
jgi:4-amino-4-deoxy-L-arabinose transferase-like glycosyltransferase